MTSYIVLSYDIDIDTYFIQQLNKYEVTVLLQFKHNAVSIVSELFA